MLSRAEVPRVAFEWLLRAASIALLSVLVLRVLHPERRGQTVIAAGSGALSSSITSWTTRPPSALHLGLDSVPNPVLRDWLRALSHAVTSVTWSGPLIPATAATVTRMIDPVPRWRVSVAAPRGQSVVMRDDAGMIDTARASGIGVTAVLPDLVSRFGATVNGTTAWTTVRDSVILRRLLVEGAASWETKFAIAALQERGWTVDALIHVAPGVDVREGAPSRPDTARYATVIAIDTSAALIASAATQYVRGGGGLITLSGANGIAPAGSAPVILEKRANGMVAAYSSGQGRVLRVGYPDVWRGRLSDRAGVTDPAADNRVWWADVVASVAYAPRPSVHQDAAPDAAPLAALTERIGVASIPPRAASVAGDHLVPTCLIFAALLAALLLEWASRRLRGEP